MTCSAEQYAVNQLVMDWLLDSYIDKFTAGHDNEDTSLTAGPSNNDILRAAESRPFNELLQKLQVDFPFISWGEHSNNALRVRVFRLKKRFKDLKRRNDHAGLSTFLVSKFELPTTNQGDSNVAVNLQETIIHAKENEKENKQLKRQLEVEREVYDNLKTQIQHSETKTQLLLDLLDHTTQKHKEAFSSVNNNFKMCKKECQSWEMKYKNLSEKLDTTLEHLQEKKDKLKTLCVRNQNKKLKRRDEKIEKLETDASEKARENELLKEERDEQSGKIERLRREKKNLLVKVCRLNKQTNFTEREMSYLSNNEMKIEQLKNEIRSKEEKIIELEKINETLQQEEIDCMYDGRFSNEIRETIMTLVTTCGVSLNKVNSVIQTVIKNITGKSLSRLPSAGVRSRLLTEAKRVAQVQVAEAMLNDVVRDDDETFFGNCLHQDGTSKFHKHFQSFQVTTSDKTTYSLGLTEIGSADAATLMETFKSQMHDLSDALKGDNQAVVQLVRSIVSTMSDQGATNPVFNRQLNEYKQSILPTVIEDWDNLSDTKKTELGKVTNFFCKMHIFVNMASEVDKCLMAFESSICNGRNPYSFDLKESGASRLTRTVSKAFTMRGCEKSGVGNHFTTHLEERQSKNMLITFRGHRFNHLFYAAGATYFHANEIVEFLNLWADPNDLLKSISFDIREKAFLCGIRALGIIDKLITGPLWRLIESSENILSLNPYLTHLQQKLNEFSMDASPLLSGTKIFENVPVHKDAIYEKLFMASDDPIVELYTQMALELCAGGMLLILERQAKDQLSGGALFEPSETDLMRGSSVPTTNTCSERDFAQLDLLMRLKPSAGTTAYESIIMWSNNKTSEWIQNLDPHLKNKLLDEARVNAPCMIASFQSRQKALYNKKLEILKQRQEKKAAQENRQYVQKIQLTTKLNHIGKLWCDTDDIVNYETKLQNDKKKDAIMQDAIITQLQFRKYVLGGKGPKEKFQQSSKGKSFSLEELKQNLIDIIHINGENENTTIQQEPKLNYIDESEANDNFIKTKEAYAKKLQDSRRTITIKQQSSLLQSLIQNPQNLVGKIVSHKFKNSDEIVWYRGEVLSVHKYNGRLTKYQILYDGEEDICKFPLLVDMERGELILL